MNKRHPYLRFDGNPLAKERYATLSKLVVGVEKNITLATLEELGVQVDVMSRIQCCGLLKLFDMNEDICPELLLELLSTLTVNWQEGIAQPITFRLGKVERKLSFSEFGLACGAYELGCDDFGVDPREIQFKRHAFFQRLNFSRV